MPGGAKAGISARKDGVNGLGDAVASKAKLDTSFLVVIVSSYCSCRDENSTRQRPNLSLWERNEIHRCSE